MLEDEGNMMQACIVINAILLLLIKLLKTYCMFAILVPFAQNNLPNM